MPPLAGSAPEDRPDDHADDGVSYVQARYRENPVLVIGVAIGALIAVGVIVRSIFRR